MKYIIGTRGSKLALAQAEYVKEKLTEKFPEHEFVLEVIRTKGDKIQDRPLYQIGGKGLFVKEIEDRILEGTIHIGVHSMKDMPTILPEGLIFASQWKGEDSRDVLILRQKKSLAELPSGAVIGTGSIRRQVQLKKLRPDINTVNIRGNVDTRLEKMEKEKLDGIILAAAGLHRLNRRECISQYFSLEEMVPAPAQGVLALEIREDNEELKTMLEGFSDADSAFRVKAEREFLKLSGGDCHTPVGAACEKISEKRYRLHVFYGDTLGEQTYRVTVEGEETKKLAKEAWERIRGEKK